MEKYSTQQRGKFKRHKAQKETMLKGNFYFQKRRRGKVKRGKQIRKKKCKKIIIMY